MLYRYRRLEIVGHSAYYAYQYHPMLTLLYQLMLGPRRNPKARTPVFPVHEPPNCILQDATSDIILVPSRYIDLPRIIIMMIVPSCMLMLTEHRIKTEYAFHTGPSNQMKSSFGYRSLVRVRKDCRASLSSVPKLSMAFTRELCAVHPLYTTESR